MLVVHPEPAARPPSVALLAGSFDPVTIGHAAMAEAATTLADLVVLVYAVRTLPKEGSAPPALLPEEQRVLALERFCEARGFALGLSSHGLLADQVAAAAGRFPGSELVVVVGSDKLLQLFDRRWYDDVEAALRPMFERARVAYTMRAGHDDAVRRCLSRPEHARWADRVGRLSLPPEVVAVSSREVRERLARGEDATGFVPPEVLAFLPRG